MYDSLLRKKFFEGISIIGYADDIALVGKHRNWDSLVRNMNAALTQTNSWMEENGLQLAAEKTEAIVLKFGRRSRDTGFVIKEQIVLPKDRVKYLGIVLDASVSFGPHIRTVAAKAEASVRALSRLMPNVGGPSERKRRVLGAVVQSILLYGAPVWADSLNVKAYRQALQSVQRKVALRICGAYRTVSYDAATVLASQIPIHLLARETKEIWNSNLPKKETAKAERRRTLMKWQEEWTSGTKGAWTRCLIPDIIAWTQRRYGKMGFYLTQAFSGHGVLCPPNREGKGRCVHFGETDTPEHVIFQCSRDIGRRNEMNAAVGREVTPANITRLMRESEDNWRIIEKTVVQIIKEKESAECQDES